MGFTNVEQVRELFLSCGMGFLLGAYYDVFRILRCLLRPGAVRVFWQDLVFFVTAAFATFLFALAVNDGALRVYLFAGLIAGFFAYRYTVGSAVVRLVTVLVALLSRIGLWLNKMLVLPVDGISKLCRDLLKKIRKNLKKLKKGLETDGIGGV